MRTVRAGPSDTAGLVGLTEYVSSTIMRSLARSPRSARQTRKSILSCLQCSRSQGPWSLRRQMLTSSLPTCDVSTINHLTGPPAHQQGCPQSTLNPAEPAQPRPAQRTAPLPGAPHSPSCPQLFCGLSLGQGSFVGPCHIYRVRYPTTVKTSPASLPISPRPWQNKAPSQRL